MTPEEGERWMFEARRLDSWLRYLHALTRPVLVPKPLQEILQTTLSVTGKRVPPSSP